MWLLLLFLTIPMIEIALFIQVGGLIGLLPTLAICVLTAIAGSMLMRDRGGRELQRLRQSLNTMSDPTDPLAHGAMIFFAGVLLLVPGFFTDICGILLMFRPVREAVLRQLRKRVKLQTFSADLRGKAFNNRARPARYTDVIEGDFSVDQDDTDDDRPSKWTRH